MVAPGGAYAIRPYTGTRTNKPTGRSPQQTNIKRATGPNGWTPDMIVRPVPGRLVGRMQYAPTRVRRRPRPNSPASADAPRQTPRDLRRLRKPHGKCRETCAACANATANAERLAPPAQTPRQTPRDPRRLRKRHGKRRETPRRLRKRHGKRRETCAACANLLRIQNNL